MATGWTDQQIKLFIQLFYEQPCLWKTSNIRHKYYDTRQKCIQRIVNGMHRSGFYVKEHEVKNRIVRLRAYYRGYLFGENKTKMWIIHDLSFLEENLIMQLRKKQYVRKYRSVPVHHPLPVHPLPVHPLNLTTTTTYFDQSPSPPTTSMNITNMSDADTSNQLAIMPYQKYNNNNTNSVSLDLVVDNEKAFANMITTELKQMNLNTKLRVQTLIRNIIYQYANA